MQHPSLKEPEACSAPGEQEVKVRELRWLKPEPSSNTEDSGVQDQRQPHTGKKEVSSFRGSRRRCRLETESLKPLSL